MDKEMFSDSTQTILIVIAVVIMGFLVMNYLNGNDVEYVDPVVQVDENFEDYENMLSQQEAQQAAQQAAQQQAAQQQAAQQAAQQQAAQQAAQQQQQQGVRRGPQPAQSDSQSSPEEVPRSSQNGQQLPNECYPRQVLNAVDLLPSNDNNVHSQVSPSGSGALSDKNFLTSGFHIGTNTVGQTLRNANRQLRSDPPNPQVKVSPWMQTTIEPDTNRKGLEIGCE